MSQKINVYHQLQIRHEDEDMYYDTVFIMNNVIGCKYRVTCITLM
jgi:hypothetical protein